MKRSHIIATSCLLLSGLVGCGNQQVQDAKVSAQNRDSTAFQAPESSMAQMDDDSAVHHLVKKLFDEALLRGKSFEYLRSLTKIGGRLSGSENAAKAVEWSYAVMQDLSVDKVWKQDVIVPKWVRGPKEKGKAILANGKEVSFAVCALGGSIATPKKGLRAPVVEVQYFNELEEKGKDYFKGKIIFFNRKMDPRFANTFYAYSNCVKQRWAGAAKAAEYGAIGVVVRSLSLSIDDYPHTGSMGYVDSVAKIPAISISTRGAEDLSALLYENDDVEFYFSQQCALQDSVPSHNVIGEITGSTYPNEIIVIGGHLDSWDLGDGAHDDGAGCAQSLEVLRLFKELGIQPKRTIRAVMFMNEENGLRGGKTYARLAKKNGEKHIAAIETDRGGFAPQYFSFEGSDTQGVFLRQFVPYLEEYGISNFKQGGSGADIGPLRDQGTLLIGLVPESQRYFDYHHCAQDKLEAVNPRELALGSASIATLAFFLSEYGTESTVNL